MKKNWTGVFVATVTPFRDGSVDAKAVAAHTRLLLDGGVHGLCPAGTTGEGSALDDRDFTLVVETVLKEAGGKVPVLPGTGSNDTKKTVERTKLAKKLGMTWLRLAIWNSLSPSALRISPAYSPNEPDVLFTTTRMGFAG